MLTSSFELLRTMAPLCTRAALGGGIERLGALAAAVKAGDCATVRWYDCRGALECWRAAGSKSEGSAGRVELCSCAGAIGGGRGWLKFEMLISLFVFTLAAWSRCIAQVHQNNSLNTAVALLFFFFSSTNMSRSCPPRCETDDASR